MSDDLVVSGGGSVVVASDRLLVQAQSLGALVGELAALRDDTRAALRVVPHCLMQDANAPLSALYAETGMEDAANLLGRFHSEAQVMSFALHAAMENYGRAEDAVETMARQLAAHAGYAAGFFAPLAALFLLPVLGNLAVEAVVAGFFVGKNPAEMASAMGASVKAHASLLTDPVTVALVRATVGSSDDFLGGLFHLPAPVVELLGDDGLGITGLRSSAAMLAVAGTAAGLLGETAVSATRTHTAAVTAPRSVADRVRRIPSPASEANGEQIRIERYPQPDGPDRFEVYVSGTVDFAVPPATEPFDMTSNITGIGGLPPGSLVAVQQAMASAGVTPDTPVGLTGYSQGGLVATMVAASGSYTVASLLTVGSPSGLVPLSPDIPVLTIRHTDDIVPATGGYDVNPQAVVVEREVFAGVAIPTETAVPAHQLEHYRHTAELVDRAGSTAVRAAVAVMEDFTALSGAGVGSTYVARRLPG